MLCQTILPSINTKFLRLNALVCRQDFAARLAIASFERHFHFWDLIVNLLFNFQESGSVKCKHCGKEFQNRASSFCSTDCALKHSELNI